MSKFIVYIRTDNNRRHFDIDFTSNIADVAFAIQQSNSFIFQQGPNLNRIIYTETFANLECAKKKMNELCCYTNMQLERLIRKHNPNWINLYPLPHHVVAKRATYYAA